MPLLEVTRNEWNAEDPKGDLSRIQPPIEEVFVTFTNTEECHNKPDCLKLVKQIQATHQDEGLPDISYSFLIGGDGRVYEGRGWFYCPCPPLKVDGCQGNSIVIAKIGPRTMEDPCKIFERATGSIIDSGMRRSIINNFAKYYIHTCKDEE